MTSSHNSEMFEVTGGTPLFGSVRVGGAKNASYKLIIAATLAASESRLLNFSRIGDIELVSDIVTHLGGSVRQVGERALFIDPTGISSSELDATHGATGRHSTMFIPVLLHRFGQAKVPAPGGDKIGKRPVDRHFQGLAALGASVRWVDGYYIAALEKPELTGTTYRFEKNTHTGTETMILAAVLAKGRTVLENAAEEPEIDDLITFLNDMGAWIRRRPNRVIEIQGVDQLQGSIHKVMADRNEAVSYACAALATKGDIVIENANASHLEAFTETLHEMGAGVEVGQYGMRFYYHQPLQAVDITTQIHPGFMTDWQPLMATVLTQCQGTSTLHEVIHPHRFQYVENLLQMGAKIEQYNPKVENPAEIYNFNLENDQPEYYHALRVHGPSTLRASTIDVVDLRHGATLTIAALAAEGTSQIKNIEHIDRGYESLDTKLQSLGAQIKRVADSTN